MKYQLIRRIHGQAYYVRELTRKPTKYDSGDYGYVDTPQQSSFVSKHWRDRWLHYMTQCGDNTARAVEYPDDFKPSYDIAIIVK